MSRYENEKTLLPSNKVLKFKVGGKSWVKTRDERLLNQSLEKNHMCVLPLSKKFFFFHTPCSSCRSSFPNHKCLYKLGNPNLAIKIFCSLRKEKIYTDTTRNALLTLFTSLDSRIIQCFKSRSKVSMPWLSWNGQYFYSIFFFDLLLFLSGDSYFNISLFYAF